MIYRHRNKSQSRFFTNSFCAGMPTDLEELKTLVREGNSSIISKLNYFSKGVRGSTSYWNNQRRQLFDWINYHVSQGNGAPTIFMTLSCAEYYWPDLRRLLAECIKLANPDEPLSDLENDIAARNKVIRKYSIIVQEYFQKRTKHYLETVCKDVFKFKHVDTSLQRVAAKYIATSWQSQRICNQRSSCMKTELIKTNSFMSYTSI